MLASTVLFFVILAVFWTTLYLELYSGVIDLVYNWNVVQDEHAFQYQPKMAVQFYFNTSVKKNIFSRYS